MLDNADLGRHLSSADNCGHRVLRSLENAVNSLDLSFHHITEHLVVREVFCDESCGSVCTVCSTECVVDVAVCIRSKLGDELLLAFLQCSLCSLLFLVGCILCKSSRFAFLFCIEAEVFQYEYLTHFEGSNLLVSLLAILCKLHRNSEKLFNTAEDVLEGEFLSHSFRTSEMGHNDERTAFFKYLLEGRNCGTNPCVVSDFEFFVERNIKVHTNNGFLASEIVS